MTEKELRKKISDIIMKMSDEELEENILHVSPNEVGVVLAVDNKIENLYPNYSEKTGEFIPQKVIEKTY